MKLLRILFLAVCLPCERTLMDQLTAVGLNNDQAAGMALLINAYNQRNKVKNGVNKFIYNWDTIKLLIYRNPNRAGFGWARRRRGYHCRLRVFSIHWLVNFGRCFFRARGDICHFHCRRSRRAINGWHACISKQLFTWPLVPWKAWAARPTATRAVVLCWMRFILFDIFWLFLADSFW